jgi:hypothetical protein
MRYSGPERRIHKVFVTKNSEYHTRKNVCVGVRDRRSGQWKIGHDALTKSLGGAFKFTQDGMMPNDGSPNPGESLFFFGDDSTVVTSSLISVVRPAKEVVESYSPIAGPSA